MRPAAIFMKRYRGMNMPHIAYCVKNIDSTAD